MFLSEKSDMKKMWSEENIAVLGLLSRSENDRHTTDGAPAAVDEHSHQAYISIIGQITLNLWKVVFHHFFSQINSAGKPSKGQKAKALRLPRSNCNKLS